MTVFLSDDFLQHNSQEIICWWN